MDDANTNAAQMNIKVIIFNSNTNLLTRPYIITTTNSNSKDFYGGLKYEEKTDFIFRCTSVTNTNATISTTFDLLLVENPGAYF